MVPIWIAFARHIITNLTTPSGSTRGFTILMLGRYFGAMLIESGQIPREDALDVVLRMEQLGAYSRHLGHRVEGDIRGIERVKAHIRDSQSYITIQTNKQGLILADQKVYGLWGLFSVAARTSGIIPEGSIGVEPITQEFIEENYLPIIGSDLKSLLDILAKGGRLKKKKPGRYFKALVEILSEDYTPSEIQFYGRYIRDAELVPGNKQDRQGKFRRLLEDHADLSGTTSRQELLTLARHAEKIDSTLARALTRITQLEALLAPADALFSYVQRHRGKKPQDVAEKVRAEWGIQVPNLDLKAFNDLVPEIADVTGSQIAAVIKQCYEALAGGKYSKAIQSLLQWNEQVMGGRHSAPWVRLDERGKLDVRYASSDQLFPSGEQLGDLWRNSYFVESLKRVTRQLQAVR